jgi:hypothetical protein
MKKGFALAALATAAMGGMAVTTSGPAHAVVYCQYISYPANCVARPGVRLVARPVARAATVGVGRGTPANRGGPVNRVGRR